MAEGDLDISTGGVLAVDSEQLRDVHDQLIRVRDGIEIVPGRLQNASGLAGDVGREFAEPTLVLRMRELSDEVAQTCASLMATIQTFELVEARLSGTPLIEQQRDRPWWDWLGTTRWFRDPTLAERADDVIAEWQFNRTHPFAQKAADMGLFLARSGLGPLSYVVLAALGRAYPALVDAVGRGVIPGHAPLAPKEHSTSLHVTTDTRPRPPIRGVEDAVIRMQMTEDAQVSVETYEMPDGTSQYIVYIKGTDLLDPGQPWDMQSNTDLYMSQQESASFAAAESAMRLAGIQPSDPILLFTHSQGGMIGTHLAASGEFTVLAHTSFGNPVQAVPIPGVLDVPVRHKDDPVARLAGGGTAMETDDSVLVERLAFPETDIRDFGMRSHHLDAYRETAALMDKSPDGRLDDLRAIIAGFDRATLVTARNFTADDPAR
ncbi:hypothetical protein ACWIBQ_12525 [Microbacterium keratanolyticum]